MSAVSAWKASETCMWGMISSLVSTRSLVIRSASISVRPRCDSESIRPGYTVMPLASTNWAFAGTLTPSRRPDGGDFPLVDHQHAVLDGAVSNGQQLSAGDGDGLVRVNGGDRARHRSTLGGNAGFLLGT